MHLKINGLRSRAHHIFGETVCKVAFSPDTKGYIAADGVYTLAFGHKDIPSHYSESAGMAGELIDFLKHNRPLPS